MKAKVYRNLQLGFGFSIIVLLVISLISYLSIRNLLISGNLVDHSHLVIEKFESIISLMKDAETGQRGFLLTNNDDFLEPYNGSYDEALVLTGQVKILTRDNRQQQINIDAVKGILLERLIILKQLIDKKRSGLPVTIEDLNKGKHQMDALRLAIGKAETHENALLNARVSELNKYVSLTPIFIVTASLLSLLISIFSFFRISGDIKENEILRNSLVIKEHETSDMNDELAAANEELTSINEEYLASNEELTDSRRSLEVLNNELEERIESRTKALFTSERRFRQMMETIPQIAWTNLPDGEVDYYNQRWYDYTGLDFEQTKAWGWRDVIHPDDLQYNITKYQLIRESKEGGEFEIREKRIDGAYRWHLIRMVPVKNEDGEIQLWVGTATDIHELKQLQQQKDDFISIASHELKTPVTALKASLQLLYKMKEKPAPVVFPRLIEQANKSSNRIGSLIDDLLNVSKINHGQLHLNKTIFNIASVINDCCHHIRLEGKFTIETKGDVDTEVLADAERIEQVVVNFVNNAVKYAFTSNVIEVCIENLVTEVKVSVIDSGNGIPAEKIPHLFDRYYRVDTSGIQYSGLGLGLYICAEIIKKHNGRIGVDSILGKGSKFWFTLPLLTEANGQKTESNRFNSSISN